MLISSFLSRAKVERLTRVLDTVLKDRTYLVGNKLTVADLAFITWDVFTIPILKETPNDLTKFTHFMEWTDRVSQRASVKKILAEREKLLAAKQQ